MLRHRYFLSLLLTLLVGCLNTQKSLQMVEDGEREKDLEVQTVGEVTEVANVGPLQVSGVGLVRGLEWTGGSPVGSHRSELERHLVKLRVEHVKELLDSKDNALVLVNGWIPAGSRRGEPIDVEVTLPPGSKATSLVGGVLQECYLMNYAQSKDIGENKDGSNRLLKGHVLARARGALVVGFENNDDSAELKHGRVWQGGTSLIERSFIFVMKKDDRTAHAANAVAERLNFMFQEEGGSRRKLSEEQKSLMLVDSVAEKLNQKSDGRREIAKAHDKDRIDVAVPYVYRFNPERYLRVARLTPLRDERSDVNIRYRKRLQKMLLEPADTIRAALRLEALGKDSIPVLKEGLASSHPLVRFASAEALTYLGNTAGVEELSQLARQYPYLANLSLISLSSLDESICRIRLAEMLRSEDIPLRCAAFFALRLADEQDPRLHGEFLQNTFWLHVIAVAPTQLVSYAVEKRPEIVLYGGAIKLSTPLRILVGKDFTVTAAAGDDRCTVSRISAPKTERKQCALNLEDVLRTLADLEGTYVDAVDFLKKLEERECIQCKIAPHQFPPEVTIETLIQAGRVRNNEVKSQ